MLLVLRANNDKLQALFSDDISFEIFCDDVGRGLKVEGIRGPSFP